MIPEGDQQPSLDDTRVGSGGREARDPQEPVWEYVWNWYRGAGEQGTNRAVDDTDALVERLRSMDDAEAIGAAYTLGNIGEIEPLLEALTSPDVALRCVAGYGFAPLGSAAVAPLLGLVDGASPELLAAIADILGDIGPAAVDALPALTQLLQNDGALGLCAVVRISLGVRPDACRQKTGTCCLTPGTLDGGHQTRTLKAHLALSCVWAVLQQG